MAHERKEGRRPRRRAIRPTIDGRLEPRLVLSHLAATPPHVGTPRPQQAAIPSPPVVQPIQAHVAAGGAAAVVTNTDGGLYFISVINGGTVRVFPAPGGRVSIVVDGSTIDTLLEINQASVNPSKNSAHTFNVANQTQLGMLNVASITVTSGTIGAIEGYRDAILSGPIIVAGPNRVDRIAFEAIAPGASIAVGGDLNTLDVLNDANFGGSAGLFVGRDLNSLAVGGNLSFTGGAKLYVGRDVGLSPQAAKGTGTAGQGINVTGNLTVGPGSGFSITRFLDGFIVVNGNFSGAAHSLIGGLPIQTYRAINATLLVNNIFIRGFITP